MANPLACAAANASLDLFESEPRLEQSQQIESCCREQLECCRQMPHVVDVRCKGAIGVIQVDQLRDVDWLRQRFVAEGVWLRPFGDAIYMTPRFRLQNPSYKSCATSRSRSSGSGQKNDRHCLVQPPIKHPPNHPQVADQEMIRNHASSRVGAGKHHQWNIPVALHCTVGFNFLDTLNHVDKHLFILNGEYNRQLVDTIGSGCSVDDDDALVAQPGNDLATKIDSRPFKIVTNAIQHRLQNLITKHRGDKWVAITDELSEVDLISKSDFIGASYPAAGSTHTLADRSDSARNAHRVDRRLEVFAGLR